MFKKNHKPKPLAATEEDTSSSDLVSQRAKLENERMSRRQALRKMGVMSGVAVVALLSVDDLARLAAKQLASSGGDSELASSVAKSLRSAGIAFAAGGDPNITPPFPEPGANVVDCGARCLRAAKNHLVNNLTDKGVWTNADQYCKNKYSVTIGGTTVTNSFGVDHCVLENLLDSNAVDSWIVDQTGPFLDCCREQCHNNKEGTGSCVDVYDRQPDYKVNKVRQIDDFGDGDAQLNF